MLFRSRLLALILHLQASLLTFREDAMKPPFIGVVFAMVDVNATIAIARLIKEKQPKLFSYAFKNRTKEAVKNKIQTPMGTPILYTASQFTNPNGCTAMFWKPWSR